MKVNIHAGHCPDGGSGACGAVGLIKESTEARKVVKYAKYYLELAGVTVYDCTCEAQVNKNECLRRIVAKCNEHDVDLDISVHFNDGANPNADGKTTGTEDYVLSKSGSTLKLEVAERFNEAMKEQGFKNRGIKVKKLYVLQNTKAPAILVEVAFVNDPEDVALYLKIGPKTIGKILAEAIVGKEIKEVIRYKTTAKSLNLRETPGMDGKVILSLKEGGIVKNLGKEKTVKGITWVNVQATVSGDKHKGWMSKRYLKVYE